MLLLCQDKNKKKQDKTLTLPKMFFFIIYLKQSIDLSWLLQGPSVWWLVVEGDVVHAEVGMKALEGAVRRVHGAAAAVAAQGHRVGHHGVDARGAVGQLKGLVVHGAVRAHVLIHVAEGDLEDGVLKRDTGEGCELR